MFPEIIFFRNWDLNGPLVSILRAFEWQRAGFRSTVFGLLVKKGGHLEPNLGKIISGNIFDHKEDTLGIILSPISGLWDHYFPF